LSTRVSGLQREVCATLRPAHRLALGEAFGDDPVNCALDEAGRDALAGTVSLSGRTLLDTPVAGGFETETTVSLQLDGCLGRRTRPVFIGQPIVFRLPFQVTLWGCRRHENCRMSLQSGSADMRKPIIGLLTLVSSLTSVSIAEATPFSPTTLITDFNVITNGNFATTSDVQGNVLVAGNLSGSGILNSAAGAPAPPTGYGQIDVFGTNSGTWAEPAGRNVFIGTGNTGAFLSATVTGPPYVCVAV
jgi:hypothetical protein